MGLKCGIVGLPNVGKSTLFNALTKTSVAQSANFPFCTIEPNSGIIVVPDERLDAVKEINNSQKKIPSSIEIVDIAGLVKGAHKGQGLGNQFLANIREVDAIVHVLRCFENEDILHVEDGVDPTRDAETVNTELLIADLESIEKKLPKLEKKAKSNDKEAIKEMELLTKIKKGLDDGLPVRAVELDEKEREMLPLLQLLTSKPTIYVCNVDEESVVEGNKFTKQVEELAKQEGTESVLVSAQIEQELSTLEDAEKQEYLEMSGITESGLDSIARVCYKILGLETYFTSGPKESRAWAFKKGMSAPEAAGIIHSDFQRGFIAAEVISYADFIEFKGEQGAKQAGKWRQEGKEYKVEDGDVILFRFNV